MGENQLGKYSSALGLVLVLMLSIPTSAMANDGVGCEDDSTWAYPRNTQCVLEYPAEARILMGIRFQHYIANCPTSFGAGKDGPVYIKFENVKPDGIVRTGNTYSVEAWFGHDCRDFAGAYDLDIAFVDALGSSISLEYSSESYHSYQSSRVSSVGQNYCLMYSCGNTYFKYRLTVPAGAALGSASLLVRAHTDPEADKYRSGAVEATFSYPNALIVTPGVAIIPTPTPTPTSSSDTAPLANIGGGALSVKQIFVSCSALWKKYPTGVASKKGYKNRGAKLTKRPVISAGVYNVNKRLDKDRDGLVCER